MERWELSSLSLCMRLLKGRHCENKKGMGGGFAGVGGESFFPGHRLFYNKKEKQLPGKTGLFSS